MLRRCLAVALLTAALDSAIAAYYLAISRDAWIAAICLTAVTPYLGFLYRSWFADETSARRRLLLTTADALGAVCATAGVLWVARWLSPT